VAASVPSAEKWTAYLRRFAHAGRPELRWRGVTKLGSPPARAPTS
jgi:hypothetical protein